MYEHPENISESGLSRADLMSLTKARLSALVVVTTLFGYLLSVNAGGFEAWLLIHTLIGTTLCAFAAAVFNQILEVEADSLMERTADRPLPSRKLSPELAFAIGWVFAGLGVLHLLMKTNLAAAALAAGTIAVYIFIYTPLKTRSASNTLVGAVAGALPPCIGWAAGGGSLLSWEAMFLFGLLFFWQLPHFLAINWMYRDQYIKGGFVMWSNNDDDGAKTARLSVLFSSIMFLFMLFPGIAGLVNVFYLVGVVVLNGVMLSLSISFLRDRERARARRLFFYTLIYLPLMLLLVFFTWTST